MISARTCIVVKRTRCFAPLYMRTKWILRSLLCAICQGTRSRAVAQLGPLTFKESGRPSERLGINKAGNVRITWHWGTFVPPLLQWKSNDCYKACVCICSLRCPVCNVHAPYCRLWPAPLNKTFPHYLINDTIFEKVIEHKMCDSRFYTTFAENIFHCEKNRTRYDRNILLVFM